MNTKKPPRGIAPEYVWKEQRLTDLDDAIRRRLDTRHPVKAEWVEERNRLAQEVHEGPIQGQGTMGCEVIFPTAGVKYNTGDLVGRRVKVKLSKIGGILDGHVFEDVVDEVDGDTIRLKNLWASVHDITHIDGEEI